MHKRLVEFIFSDAKIPDNIRENLINIALDLNDSSPEEDLETALMLNKLIEEYKLN